MDRPATSRLKSLSGALLALALSGCITYSGEYANDGYYSSPARGNAYAYNDGYYGDYYYSAVPRIIISYNLFFGYPYYGYGGCSYWSPYCGLIYPGYAYGYAYGPGYGFGWGQRPHDGYGYQGPRPRHPPQPNPGLPYEDTPPSTGVDTPVVQNPIRGFPVNPIRGRPRLQSLPATPPVATGSAPAVVKTAPNPVKDVSQRTTYWRIPINQGAPAPVARRVALTRPEDVAFEADNEYVQVERAAPAGYTQVRNVYPANAVVPVPVQTPVTQDTWQAAPEVRQERQEHHERRAAREQKQVRADMRHQAEVDAGEQP